MYFKYGNYQHDSRECSISIRKEAILAPSGVQFATRERWTISGRIHSTNTQAVDTAVRSLVSAYSQNYKDAGFYMSNGLSTAHTLINAKTLYGVKVVMPPSFPIGEGGEYSTYRNYTLELEAEFPFEGDGILALYEESVRFQGTGGPKWRMRETLVTVPQAQYIKNYTIINVLQQGKVQAYGSFHAIPPPLWPAFEHEDLREISYFNANDRYHTRTSEWSYHFSSTIALMGWPGMYFVPGGIRF